MTTGLVVIALFLAFAVGARAGRKHERERCLALLHQAHSLRWSGTVRWVMNAVSEDRDELEREDVFFGPDDKIVLKRKALRDG